MVYYVEGLFHRVKLAAHSALPVFAGALRGAPELAERSEQAQGTQRPVNGARAARAVIGAGGFLRSGATLRVAPGLSTLCVARARI